MGQSPRQPQGLDETGAGREPGPRCILMHLLPVHRRPSGGLGADGCGGNPGLGVRPASSREPRGRRLSPGTLTSGGLGPEGQTLCVFLTCPAGPVAAGGTLEVRALRAEPGGVSARYPVSLLREGRPGNQGPQLGRSPGAAMIWAPRQEVLPSTHLPSRPGWCPGEGLDQHKTGGS